ncbi:MAG: hypothetical protein Q7S25_01760 [Candidatus Limnocylindria bacterium]|nr:hypothetical protein [Candidatus Limnocylindria bacterium]
MRVLARIALIALAGALLDEAGLLHGDVVRSPTVPLAVLVVGLVAIALVLLVLAVRGDGRGDAATPAGPWSHRALRVAWLAVSAAALLGLAWALDPPRPALGDVTPYRNDAIAFNECGARLLLHGRDPYTDLDLPACYEQLGIGPDRTTPLRAGAFATLERYPTDGELEAAWTARLAGRDGGEFVSRLSYPALTILLVAPATRLGWDPNALYLAFLYAAMALVTLRARAGLRPFVLTGLFGAACLTTFTAGGSSDLLYALPLTAAWLWRERGWSGIALGVAVATKQIAWLFIPFFFIAVLTECGPRAAWARGRAALVVFAATNAPFMLHDGGAWLAGILTPLTASMFPLGAGLVLLETAGAVPALPAAAHLGLTAAALVGTLAWAWRARRSSPELGVVLALLPLFFASRSLFSYFFLIPLFAMAAVARMTAGDLTPGEARDRGALTPLASPAPTVAL